MAAYKNQHFGFFPFNKFVELLCYTDKTRNKIEYNPWSSFL